MRHITSADAPELSRLIHAVWAEYNPNPEQIARVSLESNHVTLVEQEEGRLVGFEDGFTTAACDGTLRWEVDLLGVHPDYRGRGIAQRLVRASLEGGRESGANVARALVKTDNAASLNTFRRCGFAMLESLHELYVSEKAVDERVFVPPSAHLISVSTLTYSGVWVEGSVSPDALRAAQSVRTRYGWSVAGAVIPAGTIEPPGYDLAGQYYWLQMRL